MVNLEDVFSFQKAFEEIGFKPDTPLEEGLKKNNSMV